MENLNLNQQSTLSTVNMCVHITAHNPSSTLLSSRQSSSLRCCLLEERASNCFDSSQKHAM